MKTEKIFSVFLILFLFILSFALSSSSSSSSVCLLHRHQPTSHIHFSLCLLLGDMKLSQQALKSARLVLPLSLFSPLNSYLFSPLSGCSDPHLGVAGFRLHPLLIGECVGEVAVRGPGGREVMDGPSSGPLLSVPRPLSSHCLPRARLC